MATSLRPRGLLIAVLLALCWADIASAEAVSAHRLLINTHPRSGRNILDARSEGLALGNLQKEGMDLFQLRECHCEGSNWALDDVLARWQYFSDFFIFLSYFSIPVELMFFIYKSQVFPYRWVVVQFGSFIILCGLTHLAAMGTYKEHSYGMAMTMTLLKVLTAVVSCATAITLVHIIPELLSVKIRELFLKKKTEALDQEMGVLRTQEETGRHVRMLTHEIRSSLDRHTILKTTLMELARTLSLGNCTIWMPAGDAELQLTHELNKKEVQHGIRVPKLDTAVQAVLSSNRAQVLRSSCPLACSQGAQFDERMVAAVRVPLLQTTQPIIEQLEHRGSLAAVAGTEEGGGSRKTGNAEQYAVLVLVLPNRSARQWKEHELEMVEVVADQVAVGLCHAAVIEEVKQTRDKLIEQNHALQIARQEAETAVRARNDFLAVMNHEMRTPMHAIIALSSLLQDMELTTEQRTMVDTIVKSSALLSTLINDILDFSRLEDGSLGLDLQPFDLTSSFKEAEKLAQPMAQSKGLALTLSIDPTVPRHVVGDEKRLLQTTLNLVGNAIKFTKKGVVTVRVSVESFNNPDDPALAVLSDLERTAGPPEDATWIRVQVSDTGLGIKTADISKLFQKFVQADSTTTRNYGGTGLGLAICRKFVNLMGGHIWIESEGLGKGTAVTFVVRLGVVPTKSSTPRGPEDTLLQEQYEAEDAIIERVELRNLRVLVMDDNSVNRQVTRRLLDRLGCTTTMVDSGQACLATLAEGRRFDVLLLDLSMPGMDGYEVCYQIQHLYARDCRPLIVGLTGNTDRETRERCMALNMDGIILKPIALEEMAEVLFELVHGQFGPTWGHTAVAIDQPASPLREAATVSPRGLLRSPGRRSNDSMDGF